jgi:intein/homing endonuclease
MPVPKEMINLYDKFGNKVDVAKLIIELKDKSERVLVEDDDRLVLDISDLELYTFSLDFETGKHRKQKVMMISRAKSPGYLLRITTKAGVQIECAKDTILFVRDRRGVIKQIRADKLREGMEVLGVKNLGIVVY